MKAVRFLIIVGFLIPLSCGQESDSTAKKNKPHRQTVTHKKPNSHKQSKEEIEKRRELAKAEKCAELYGQKVALWDEKIELNRQSTDAKIRRLNELPNPSPEILEDIADLQKEDRRLSAELRSLERRIIALGCKRD